MFKQTVFVSAVVAILIASAIQAATTNPREEEGKQLLSSDYYLGRAQHYFNKMIKKEEEGDKENNLKSWPKTVSTLNVTAYLGRWYNVYANWFVLATFQNHSVCATATYGYEAPTRVSVFNWERYKTTSGTIKNISGYAVQKDPTTYPGRLGVFLNGTWGHNNKKNKFLAPYWIFELGPIVDGRYQWAIVSDWLHMTLFILTRNLDEFDRKYKQEVLAIAKKRGFSGLNKPILIPQGPQCNYEWN